jgi:hypothetical protein
MIPRYGQPIILSIAWGTGFLVEGAIPILTIGMAGTTGLEPAASAVTGQRSNQLNYVPTRINRLAEIQKKWRWPKMISPTSAASKAFLIVTEQTEKWSCE